MALAKRVNDTTKTAHEIIRLLTARGQTLAVAESCTGGLIGHLLTEIPGSSEAFLGGVIVYANAVKEMVGVPADTLQKQGAVSAETAEALASGIRRWAGADYGLSVTGIAGPGGATDTKPVGLTFVGLASADRIECEQHLFTGDRSQNKLAAAKTALNLLYRTLSPDSRSDAAAPRGSGIHVDQGEV
jgi:PncC family amidohydrolase